MKKLSFAAAVCLLGIASLSAFASPIDVKVTLPYPTAVGSTTLPAGEYTFREFGGSSGTSVVQIYSASGSGVTALVMPIIESDSHESDQTRVILKQNGDKYELEKLWIAGEKIGYEFVTAGERH